MRPLKGYRRPTPEKNNLDVAMEFEEELEREKELRETILEIETDLQRGETVIL